MGKFHLLNLNFPIATLFPMRYSWEERVQDMGLRESFQKLVEKKQEEIRDLEIQVREARAYVQALQDSVRLLPKEESKSLNPKGSPATLRDGTNLARAREILLEARGPLHVNDILGKMGKPIDQASRVSLVGTLGSYSRKGKIFTRTGPNIFGLIEFDALEGDRLVVKDEEDLPADFGKNW